MILDGLFLHVCSHYHGMDEIDVPHGMDEIGIPLRLMLPGVWLQNNTWVWVQGRFLNHTRPTQLEYIKDRAKESAL